MKGNRGSKGSNANVKQSQGLGETGKTHPDNKIPKYSQVLVLLKFPFRFQYIYTEFEDVRKSRLRTCVWRHKARTVSVRQVSQ